MNHRLSSRLAVGMVVGLLAIACSNSNATPQSQAAAEEKQTLNLWIFEGEVEFVPQLTQAFMKEHPNITIKVTDIPEGQYVTKTK